MSENTISSDILNIIEEITHIPPTREEIIQELERRQGISSNVHEQDCLQYYHSIVVQYPFYNAQLFLQFLSSVEHWLRRDQIEHIIIRNLILSLKSFVVRGYREGLEK